MSARENVQNSSGAFQRENGNGSYHFDGINAGPSVSSETVPPRDSVTESITVQYGSHGALHIRVKANTPCLGHCPGRCSNQSAAVTPYPFAGGYSAYANGTTSDDIPDVSKWSITPAPPPSVKTTPQIKVVPEQFEAGRGDSVMPLAYGDTMRSEASRVRARQLSLQEAGKKKAGGAKGATDIPFAKVRPSDVPPPPLDTSIQSCFERADNSCVTLEIRPEFRCRCDKEDSSGKIGGQTSVIGAPVTLSPVPYGRVPAYWVPVAMVATAALMVFAAVIVLGKDVLSNGSGRSLEPSVASVASPISKTGRCAPSISETGLAKKGLVSLMAAGDGASATQSEASTVSNTQPQHRQDTPQKRRRNGRNRKNSAQSQFFASSAAITAATGSSSVNTPNRVPKAAAERETSPIHLETSHTTNQALPHGSDSLIPLKPSRSVVKKVMADIAPYVQGCKFDRSGKVVVKLVVSGKTGRVISSEAVDNNFKGTPAGLCVSKVVRSVQLPVFNSERLVIKYPFQI